MTDTGIGTILDELTTNIYDFRDEGTERSRVEEGLTEDIVRRISEEKKDPDWMREFRLKALNLYDRIPVPDWGPSIEGLDMDNIVTYVRPKSDMRARWEDVPQEIARLSRSWGSRRRSMSIWLV